MRKVETRRQHGGENDGHEVGGGAAAAGGGGDRHRRVSEGAASSPEGVNDEDEGELQRELAANYADDDDG